MKKTQKQELLDRFSLDHIRTLWTRFGMYKSAEILECNPWIVYHLAREHKWTRALPEFLVKAYKNGDWKITERYYINEYNKD